MYSSSYICYLLIDKVLCVTCCKLDAEYISILYRHDFTAQTVKTAEFILINKLLFAMKLR
jgi:hypothetical protein